MRSSRRLDDPVLLASLSLEVILVCNGSSISYYADRTALFTVIVELVIVGDHGGCTTRYKSHANAGLPSSICLRLKFQNK